MLRAIIFRTDLQHELGGSRGAVVRMNAARPQLAFIPSKRRGLPLLSEPEAALDGFDCENPLQSPTTIIATAVTALRTAFAFTPHLGE